MTVYELINKTLQEINSWEVNRQSTTYNTVEIRTIDHNVSIMFVFGKDMSAVRIRHGIYKAGFFASGVNRNDIIYKKLMEVIR